MMPFPAWSAIAKLTQGGLLTVTLPTVTVGSIAANVAGGVEALSVIGAPPVGIGAPLAVVPVPPVPPAPPAAAGAALSPPPPLLPHPAKAMASKPAMPKAIQRSEDREFFMSFTAVPLLKVLIYEEVFTTWKTSSWLSTAQKRRWHRHSLAQKIPKSGPWKVDFDQFPRR
jgi:hypothetical protein